MPNTNLYCKAREWIYRNARPLDLARWQYHFENGSRENVLKALTYYQNEDGGFGYALEADSWNPNSSPIQTWVATEILIEIDFDDKEHSIIHKILSYLDNGADFNKHFWFSTIQSNNSFPHAPWWYTESDSTCHNDYNPTACLAGFALKYADKDSRLYAVAFRVAKEALDAYRSIELLKDSHTSLCYIRLMEYCESIGNNNDISDLTWLKEKLKKQVKSSISQDKEKWENSYICKPSQFFNSTNSIFYRDNKEIADYECDNILRTQLDDGSWNIPWSWNAYPEEWAISKNWWKSNGVILNMLYLKGFKKI